MRVAIVGRGPSLAHLRSTDLTGYAYIIALNDAILRVRQVQPPLATIMTMQKDGCLPHSGTDFVYDLPPHDCPPDSAMIAPLAHETLIVTAEESRNCFASHPKRIVLHPKPWWTMSVIVATEIALVAANEIAFFCFDSYTRDDYATWYANDGDARHDGPLSQGYLVGAQESARLCARAGVAMQWVTPE